MAGTCRGFKHSQSGGNIKQLYEGALFEAMSSYVTAQTATVWIITASCGCAERYGLREPLLAMTQSLNVGNSKFKKKKKKIDLVYCSHTNCVITI
jgi:hypothetical protein